ncbi:MAG: ATP-dependent DNA helicase RecG [Parcubacteria group bacterium]|nr:ATP-dependent DNA helicase RecG [Parcubacteria group bacterium]
MAIHLNSSVSELPGIGGKAYQALKTLGVSSVQELLWYVPFRYDDFSIIKGPGEVVAGETCTVRGTLQSIKSRPAKNSHMKIVDAVIEDETGELAVIWFNQSYLERTLRPGSKLSIAGRIDDRYGLSIVNPIIEKGTSSTHTGRIVPVYGLTGSITMRRLRDAIKVSLPAAEEMVDWIPNEILEKESLIGLAEALRGVHFPESREELDQAIIRLKFDELFLHQMMFARVRSERTLVSAHKIPLNEELLKTFVEGLPFKLTTAQRKATWDIVQDLDKPHPMNRLLEGDVGSGKSVVAAAAIKSVADAGHISVYLAPTEILAAQQHIAISSFLGEPVSLLTRSMKKIGGDDASRDEILSGKTRCIVGTHALLQDRVSIPNVGLIVVDEQHRFGVEQRHALLDTGDGPAPHLLSMTATPIPRSLALSIYGDLDLSVLDEMPPGRKPIATALVPAAQQEGMWQHVRELVESGQQAFVVCPLIDPSDKLGAKSVTQVEKELSKGSLKGLKLATLHGRLKPDQKEKAIQDFRSGKTNVLVSTTVVEVGVDIPGATVMVIVGAERFGLAQLHQLRGRVGRSDVQSYCYLLPDNLTENSEARLQAMVESNNGFDLAEKDLLLRGPGNVFGNAQSGFPDFQLATPADVDIMKKARERAAELLDQDALLESYPHVRDRIERSFDKVHLE